jgi:soluble lytic murein transglycosylase-like protein
MDRPHQYPACPGLLDGPKPPTHPASRGTAHFDGAHPERSRGAQYIPRKPVRRGARLLSLIRVAALSLVSPVLAMSLDYPLTPTDSAGFATPGPLCSSEGSLRLGTALEERGSWALAAAAYLAGTRCHGPLQPYCRVGLARSLLALGRAHEVPPLLDVASLPVTLRPAATLLRGWAMLDQGAYRAAFLEVGSAGELAPALRCEAAVVEALALVGLGRSDSARAALSRALHGDVSGRWAGRACRILESLAADPDSAGLLDFCAGVRERRGELDRAAAHWRVRTRTGAGKGAEAAQLALARILRSQRRTAEARALVHALMSATPRREVECQSLRELAGCALKDGEDEEIAATHGEYASRCPRGEFAGEALWQRARAMERMGDYDRARGLYRTLGRSEPVDFGEECLFRQALCHYMQGDYPGAAALLDSLCPLYPASRNHYWLGKALERVGAVARAESCFAFAAGQGARPSYYSVRARHRLALGMGTRPACASRPSHADARNAAVSAATRGGRYRPVPWRDVRCHLDRAELLLRAGLGEHAAAECDWAVSRSDRHPVVRALCIEMLERGMAYPQSMQAAYRWWRERELPELLQYLHPRAYRGIVRRVCREVGVDSCLVWAVMREESWFNPEAVSPAGAVGLLQLMPHTAQRISATHGWSRVSDLRDPDSNIRLGSAHLCDLLSEFPYVEAALAAYNAGRGPTRRWLDLARVRDRDTFVESITYGETRAYVQRVVASHAYYRSRPDGTSASSSVR